MSQFLFCKKVGLFLFIPQAKLELCDSLQWLADSFRLLGYSKTNFLWISLLLIKE